MMYLSSKLQITRAIQVAIILFVFPLLMLQGCGKEAPSTTLESTCAFSSLTWDATTEDMIAEEGDDYETYDSIYKGLTYTYPKDYQGHTGMIKYMYDADGRLCNMSWAYTGTSAEELQEVYQGLCDEIAKEHGDGTTEDGVGNLCRMWVLKNETVMANAVITDDTKVMQIAYMRADVSKQKNQ